MFIIIEDSDLFVYSWASPLLSPRGFEWYVGRVHFQCFRSTNYSTACILPHLFVLAMVLYSDMCLNWTCFF